MSTEHTINRVELVSFTIRTANVGTDAAGAGVRYAPGDGDEQLRFVVRIQTDTGLIGEYVSPRGRAAVVMAACQFLSHRLIGQPALHREKLYRSMRQACLHVGQVGIGPLDIALWDLAGKIHQQPIFALLGGSDRKLPAYASTISGDRLADGLSSAEAYADFAEQCYALGYRAYKMHGWHNGNVAEESAMIRAVASRVGDRMRIMYDSACHLSSFRDAVDIGEVCDECNLYWYEDPYSDGGVSEFAHRNLKKFVRTPLLIGEFVHTPEAMTDLIVAGATDFARVDPDYDCGITGSVKAALAAETLGIDTEVHACGPAMRQLMAALAKTNYYEVNLLHPKMSNAWSLPIYACGYSDDIDCIDADGCVPVPTGPGLGVTYDTDYIKRHALDRVVIE